MHPAFMGAHPAAVRTAPLKGLHVLARKQDLAFNPAHSFDAGQRHKTMIGTRSFGDIVSGPGRSDSQNPQQVCHWHRCAQRKQTERCG